MKKIIRIGGEKTSRTINNKITLPKFVLLFVFTLGFLTLAYAQGGNLIDISGQVVDQQNKQALAGVSVSIKGSIAGTITDDAGNFKLRTKFKFPLTWYSAPSDSSLRNLR